MTHTDWITSTITGIRGITSEAELEIKVPLKRVGSLDKLRGLGGGRARWLLLCATGGSGAARVR